MLAEVALHCPACETGWLVAETDRCWFCGEPGQPDELPEALYKTPEQVARAESRAIEKVCNTYKPVARPRYA